MIARARHQAARRGLVVECQVSVIEAIAIPERAVDAVVSSFVLYSLPDELILGDLAEITRVLKPGERHGPTTL